MHRRKHSLHRVQYHPWFQEPTEGFGSLPLWIRGVYWQLTPVFLPGKSHGWKNLVGYSPWGCKESDMTEQLHFHFSLDNTRLPR